MKQTLGLIIKSQRIANRWKVKELAQKVDVTPEFITQIEKGRRYPSLEVLDRLSKILEVDLNPIYIQERHADIATGLGKSASFHLMKHSLKTKRKAK